MPFLCTGVQDTFQEPLPKPGSETAQYAAPYHSTESCSCGWVFHFVRHLLQVFRGVSSVWMIRSGGCLPGLAFASPSTFHANVRLVLALDVRVLHVDGFEDDFGCLVLAGVDTLARRQQMHLTRESAVVSCGGRRLLFFIDDLSLCRWREELVSQVSKRSAGLPYIHCS